MAWETLGLVTILLTLTVPSWSHAQSTAEKLRSFKNIVIDLRGNRFGNGDVAAGYLTAVEMIQHYHYPGSITLLVEPSGDDRVGDASYVLGQMTGRKPPQNGDTLLGGKLRTLEEGKIPARAPVVDFYLSLASPNHQFRYERSFETSLSTSAIKPQHQGGLKIDEHTVLINQTVLGNSENGGHLDLRGTLRRRDATSSIMTPGLATDEAGIYRDVLAEKLQPKSRRELTEFLRSEAGHLKDPNLRKMFLTLFNSNRDASIEKLTVVYGISRDVQKKQLETYLRSLVQEAQKKKTNITVISPSKFNEGDIESAELKKLVRFSSAKEVVANVADQPSGTVRIIETGALPHRIFVGLMAAADVPPVVAGDSALSAAIALKKPFVLTRVPWNAKNIENFRTRILNRRSRMTPEQRRAIETAFPGAEGETDLTRTLELNDMKARKAFAATSAKIPRLTESLISQATEARAWDFEQLPRNVIKDESLSYAFRLAETEQHPSLEKLRNLVSEYPKYGAGQPQHLRRLERLFEQAGKTPSIDHAALRGLETNFRNELAKKTAEIPHSFDDDLVFDLWEKMSGANSCAEQFKQLLP